MLREILLSLSGHESPLLNNDYSSPSSILSPPEKAQLAIIADLSNIHCKLLTQSSMIAASHDSSICQAVATAIWSKHLSRFQSKILEVEDSLISQNGSDLEKNYKIIPLTAIISEFTGWKKVMEWLLNVVDLIVSGKEKCSGAMLIDYLCKEMQVGYVDIEEIASSLITAAETAWLKQVSGWVLYGRLPSFGREDFFIQVVANNIQEYGIKKELLPAFVSDSTAGSLLFIGLSLNQIRSKRSLGATSPELHLLPLHLQQISSLKFPISSTNFSRVISSIRMSISQKTLKSLLPLAKVNSILSLLRELFLLGRGEFAVALLTEADEQLCSRWRQSHSSNLDNRDRNLNILPKEGEVSAVLERTWAALSALQGHHEENVEEDHMLELARDLIQLRISKPIAKVNHYTKSNSNEIYSRISSTPFKNLLLSVPTSLTMQIPSPSDLFLTPADIQVYSCINSYLLSIRRAHLRLNNLWKITEMRRHHPAPQDKLYRNNTSGKNLIRIRRKKLNERFLTMRSVWATSSAALFFLSETEAYFQGEVVQSTWTGFKKWINSETGLSYPTLLCSKDKADLEDINSMAENSTPLPSNLSHSHDPQSLADAHQKYLSSLSSNLLLTISMFTDPLYHLLQQIDYLVALVHRIHTIWKSLDLETDEGVVDAFSDFHEEEKDVKIQLRDVTANVKKAIESLISNSLRNIDQDKFTWDNCFRELALGQEDRSFVPPRVGRVDRLLMKLNFGCWFDDSAAKAENDEYLDD